MKLGDFKPKSGGNSERVKISELLPIEKFKDGKWITIRLLPIDGTSIKTHWINILAGKDKREVGIPKTCLSHDPVTDEVKEGVECPYCDLGGKAGFGQVRYYVNAILRSAQEDQPRKLPKPTKGEAKTGFKDPDSDSWTPVRVFDITPSLMQKIQELTDLNKVTVKGKDGKKKTTTYSPDDVKYGIDIEVRFDSKKSGTDMYQVQKGERTPLTEEELAYLVHELNGEQLVKALGVETVKVAKAELKKMEIVGEDELDDDDEDEESLGKKSKGKSKKEKSSKKSKGKKDDFDDEDDEESDDFDDEDEDEKPSKKSKGKASSKGKSKKSDDDDEDEDFDDDDFDDDEDEDEKSSKKSKGKSKKSDDDDEDEDFDDDDEDEDDDEDFDSEDDDDFDDEDEDEKSSKKSKGKASSKGKSKKSDDEDEDFDDDEDDDFDDEDEDEKPSKKSKGKAKSSKTDSKKSKGKKSKKDDDIPF